VPRAQHGKILLNMSAHGMSFPTGIPAKRHDFVPFAEHLQPNRRQTTKGKRTMSLKQREAERARAQNSLLAKHYRAIGPAAIVAALICAPKKNKPAQTVTAKAA
jgi:hypothetical protein